jgi:hypothetical protein
MWQDADSQGTKVALRATSKNTVRTIAARGGGVQGSWASCFSRWGSTVGSAVHAGDEGPCARDAATSGDPTALARVLLVKLPSSTKKSSRAAREEPPVAVGQSGHGSAWLAERGFAPVHDHGEEDGSPCLRRVEPRRNVTWPSSILRLNKLWRWSGDRHEVVLSGAVDVHWRLCFEMTGEPPAAVSTPRSPA